MSDTETGDAGQSRRQFMRITAGAVGMGVGSQILPNGPVQESEAIVPAVAAGKAAKLGGAAGGAAVGWALREFEVLGSDDPPEGMTPDALKNAIFEVAQSRASNNQSTFIDNKQIIDGGIQHTAYSEAKIAAIEAINATESQGDTLEAAETAIDEHEVTVLTNFFKSWNESVQELEVQRDRLEDHEETSKTSILENTVTIDSANLYSVNEEILIKEDNTTYEFPDGSEMEIYGIGGTYRVNDSNNNQNEYDSYHDPTSYDEPDNTSEFEPGGIGVSLPDSDAFVNYLIYHEWHEIYNHITDAFEEVRDEIGDWVDGVYGDVQAGELDTDDLLTERELSEMTAEEEGFNQAVADLQALNVSTDTEREATINLPEINATVYGNLAYTGDTTLETGEIDPDDKDGAIYLTYDVSQGQGEWSAYEEGIDGGELALTQEPFPDTLYVLETAAGETVELTADDFEHDEDEDEWTVDLSDQLDYAVTNVDQISYYAKSDETQYETVQLQNEFEIVTFEDSEGNEHESADFERSEPHDDENYITEEEWKENQERHEELIQKYEDAQGGGGGIGFLDGEEIPAEGVVLIVLAVFAVLFGR